jgi:hypothetical protein
MPCRQDSHPGAFAAIFFCHLRFGPLVRPVDTEKAQAGFILPAHEKADEFR